MADPNTLRRERHTQRRQSLGAVQIYLVDGGQSQQPMSLNKAVTDAHLQLYEPNLPVFVSLLQLDWLPACTNER